MLEHLRRGAAVLEREGQKDASLWVGEIARHISICFTQDAITLLNGADASFWRAALRRFFNVLGPGRQYEALEALRKTTEWQIAYEAERRGYNVPATR